MAAHPYLATPTHEASLASSTMLSASVSTGGNLPNLSNLSNLSGDASRAGDANASVSTSASETSSLRSLYNQSFGFVQSRTRGRGAGGAQSPGEDFALLRALQAEVSLLPQRITT